MKKLLILSILAITILFPVAGCMEALWTNPETGEQTKYHYIDPNQAGKIEQPVEAAITLLSLLSTVWPFLTPIATAAGGICLAWKRLKPKLIASENEKDNFYRGGEILAYVLEETKTNHPDVWKEIGPMIESLIKHDSDIENAIRGFRHLYPK